MRIVLVRPWGFAAPKIIQGFADAFMDLGHDVLVVKTQDLIMPRECMEQVQRVLKFKPDLAMGYGLSAHLKIEGRDFFELIGVPTAHYFADDPFHPGTRSDLERIISSDFASFWLWDKSYVPALQRRGGRNVQYLPLAANTHVFKKLPGSAVADEKYQCNISFAGNGGISERLPFISAVADLGLAVFGDEVRWRKAAGDTPAMSCYRGFLRSERELNRLYNAAKINLNVTVGQGKSSANFRVFNVTAAGGFLLTDYKEELEEHFRIGVEIEVFRSPEELREKAIHYLNNPEQAARIAAAGHARTIADHSFTCRAATIADSFQSLSRVERTEVRV